MATEAEISALYNKYLGRNPLQSGIDAWLATNQSIDQIEQGIANSPEAAVFQAFNSTMGRDPTMDEREYFVNTNPASIEVIETVLAKTPEAKALQTENQLAETDLLADTTADDTTVDAVVGDLQYTNTLKNEVSLGPKYNDEGERLYYWVPSGEMNSTFKSTGTEDDRAGRLFSADNKGGYFTEAEIKAAFEANKGMTTLSSQVTWDQYWGYLTERQDLIDAGELETGLDAFVDGRQAGQEQIQSMGGLKEAGGAKGAGKGTQGTKKDTYQDSYSAIVYGETQQALMEKHGIPQTLQLSDGSLYEFNGSSFTKTYAPEKQDFADVVATVAVTAALSAALGPVFGPGALGKGAAAGVASAGGQLVTTGDVDPASTIASAVTGGLNPGGTLSNSLGLAPDNVVSGFVQGATNDLVSNTITEGELDLQSAVVSGLIGAGVNAAKDLLTDASNNSIEAEMDRIQKDRAVKRLTDPTLPELTADQLYAAALANAQVGVSDLGGLVGEGGLLPFIEPVSTTGINNLLGGGAFLPNEVFFDSEGNRYTDLDILAGAAGEGVSPADIVSGNVEGWTSGIVTQQNTILGNAVDFAKENIPGADQLATTVSGLLDAAAAVEFKNTYGATAEEFLEAGTSIEEIQRMISYGPLDEMYNFAVNPRGTSQMVGTLSGIPGLYSTGPNNPFLDYASEIGESASTIVGVDALQDAINITNLQDNAATAAANANEGSIAILNLDGTDTLVSSETVLPGANTTIGDAILQGLLDGLLVDTNTNNATLSSGGETTTQTLDSSVVSNISNVLTTAGDVATGRLSFDDFTNTVTDLTNTTGGAGAAAVVDSVVGNTTTLSSSNTDINAGRSSFDDFSNTSDTIVNNNTTLTNNAVTNANTSDTIVNNNAVLSSVDNNVTNTLSSGSIETAVPPTTVLPSVESGGVGAGGGGLGGDGGGMLSGDPSPPFDIRQIGITAAPILQQRQEFPITESLMGGLLTGNRNRVA